MKKYLVMSLVVFSMSAVADPINPLFKPSPRENNMRKSTRDSDTPRDHVVDKYRQERHEKRDSYVTRCRGKKFKTFYEQEQCIDKAVNEYQEKYPDRGTHAYGEKFYSKLSVEEGREKRDDLLNILDRVSFHPKPGNEGIELTVEHVRDEMHYIERYVMKTAPRYYETR